ncbi:hypothetical protein OSTOST_11901, partial [Ostertagia ostertagi]
MLKEKLRKRRKRTAKRWFHKFENGDFDLSEKPRSGRPMHHDTVAAHLHLLGKSWKYGMWIPHELSGYQLQMRRDACLKFL